MRKWVYVDGIGQVLAYHCRRDEGNRKIIWWEGADQQPSNNRVHPEALPLYRLRDLEANPDLIVLVCEGEKAADSAAERGFLAVSFSGGASQTDFGSAPEPLRGRDVVLWPDADKAGVAFMRRLDTLLQSVAKSVRWLAIEDANDKDDAADYFARNGSVDTLEELVKTARPLAPDAKFSQKLWTWQELLRTHFKPPEWLLENLLPEVGLTILGGKPKVGKSWLALQIAGAVGAGDEVLARRAKRGRVLYFCIEDRAARIKSRGQLQDMADDADIIFTESLEPLDAGGMEVLDSLITEVHPAFVVIDTLASAKSSKIDENAAGPMADLCNALQRMAHTRSLAILLVAHHRKGVLGDPGADLRGSSAISAAADMIFALIKKPPAYSLGIEGRDTGDAEYRMEFEDYRWKLRGDARILARAEAEQQACEVLAQYGESDANFVAQQTGWSRATAMRVLKELEFKHIVYSRPERAYGERVTRVLYRLGEARKEEKT